MSAKLDENGWEGLQEFQKGLKAQPKIVKLPEQQRADLEFWLLLRILADPAIIGEIAETIPDPDHLRFSTGRTAHAQVYHVMLDLWESGEPIEYETIVDGLQDLQRADPIKFPFSRADIMELDWQAQCHRDKDRNRLAAKACAERLISVNSLKT